MRNLLAALAVLLLGLLVGSAVLAGPPVVSPTDLQLDGPGLNVDDPCFWRDPLDPAASLLFVTTKSSGAVEVYRAATGAFLGTISGFVRPNNCAVTGDLLLTTDRDAGNVKAHHLPDLTLVHTFGADAIKPMGVDVLHTPAGQALAYVTDAGDASVHVYDVPTGALVRHFPTGFGLGIEAVVADDLYQRVLVSREDKGGHGIGLFTPDGSFVREFGGVAFAHDTEGLAIYRCGDRGYLVAADQGGSTTEFEVFDRATLTHLATFTLDDGAGDVTNATDGVDVFQTPLPGFPGGVFAACDGCGDTVPDEMDVVGWERIAAAVHLDVCPDGAEPDCRTTPCRERVLPLADTTVSAAPTTPAGSGSSPTLEVGGDFSAETFLRFAVPDLTGFDLEAVALRLTAESGATAGGPIGGRLFTTSATWSEADTTWYTRPNPFSSQLASGGAVTPGGTVDFDLTGVVHGGATYDFLLIGVSGNTVRYRSREAGQSPPALLLTLRASSPPAVTITSPADGATVATGAPCTLAGAASDPEDGDLSATLVWTSDVDGPLGTGGALQPTLTAGLHTITAGVTDRAGLHTTAAVHLRAAVPTTTSTSSTSSSTSSSSSSTTVVTPTTASSSSSTSTTMPGATSTSSTSTSIAPSTTASTSTTTSSSTSTSSTTTTSSTTGSVVPTTSTTSTLPPPVCTPACDDGDRCTADTCTAARGCVSVEQSATAPPGVLCILDNLRDLRRNGPPSLGRRLGAIERQVDAATRARAPGRCHRSLRGATRATHVLAAALERFAARVPGGEPAARLAREALRLQTRTATLARSFCRNGRPAGMAAQP